MISELYQQAAVPMVFTKNKRDEFLISIRKQKNQQILLRKRIKLYGAESKNDPSIQEDIFGSAQINSQKQENHSLTSDEIYTKYREAYDDFYDILNKQEWENLAPVIKDLRLCISDAKNGLPGKVLIDMNIVPHLISLLSPQFSTYQILQAEIAWLLANLSAGTSEDTRYLVEQNIIGTLAQCLRSTDCQDLYENAMWSLANIAGDNDLSYRDAIIKEGALDLIVRVLATTPKTILFYRIAAWLFSNLLRGSPYPSFDKIEKTFASLAHLVEYKDDTIQQHSLLSLVYLTDEAKETHFKRIIQNNLLKKLISYLVITENKSPEEKHSEEKIVINTLKVIRNFLKGSHEFRINLNFIQIIKALPDLLTKGSSALKNEVCIVLCHMMTNDFEDIDFLSEYDVHITLLDIAFREDEETKTQAVNALYWFLMGSNLDDFEELLEKGLLEILMQNLQSTYSRLVESSLRTLYKTLEHGDNLNENARQGAGINSLALKILENTWLCIIENFQNHSEENIRIISGELLDRFFPIENNSS